VLTAETLRTDFLDLWTGRKLPTRAVLMVTHNIEEAVLMCDRILVLGSNPGQVVAEIQVPLAQPRDRFEPQFRAIVDNIYSVQTARIAAAIGSRSVVHGGMAQPLPDITVGHLAAFLDALASADYGGRAELARIATPLGLSASEVLRLAAATHILELGELQEGAIKLSAAGRIFAQSPAEDRKRIFREHLLRFVPLAAHIRQVLDERQEHAAPRKRFELELEDHMQRGDVEQTLRAVIGWGRYAEIFAYDDRKRSFRIDAAAA
jgi:NitT/TauT family transport system ATP-binding protein